MSALLWITLALFAIATRAATELSFLTEDDSFHYRSLTVQAWSIFGAWSGVYYHSVEVDVDTKKPLAEGNYIWGSIYVGSLSYPLNWQGYFEASVAANRSITNPDHVNWATFDVAWTSSFIASAYIRIVEKNSTDGFVSSQELNGLWVYDPVDSNQLTNKTAGLYASVFHATLHNKAVVTLQYIATAQAGIVDVLGGVLVVPKSVETIVGIEGWPYAHEENTVSLVIAVGSRDVVGNVNGQLLSSGTGSEDGTFFRAAKRVSVDGEIVDIKSISVNVTADIEATFGLFGQNVASQLRTKYDKEASVGIFSVEFPAGAKSIWYDPSMGSGEDPFEEGGSKTGLIVGLTIGGIAALLLIILGVYYYTHVHKRAEYQQVG